MIETTLHFHQSKIPPFQTGQPWHEWQAERLSEMYGYRVNPENVRIQRDRYLHDPRLQIGTDGGIIAVGEWLGFAPGARKARYGKAEPRQSKAKKAAEVEGGLFG